MFAQREVSHPKRLRRAALAALMLAAPLAAGLGAAQPASAAFPGANGRIVFVGAGGLETIKADGSGLKVLSTDEYSGPSFSPDGSRIALTDDNDQLLVMSANGGSATKIADGAQMPCWSPDGTKIAFGSLNGGIVTVNADGSGLAQLTTGSDTGCAWSPDGTQIAFSRWNGSNHTLFSVPAAGGSETQLTNTSLSDDLPDWSPDGTQIVFTRASVDVKAQVYVMNADGSGATAITSSGANYHAVWSPSGRRIAFTSSRSKGLWLMSPDGSNQTHVKGTPAIYPDDWQASRVTATASKSAITYGKSTTITVHLGTFAATENHTVTLTATPAGGTTKAIGSKTVNSHGDAAFTVSPGRTTSYTATWSGDAGYPGGGISETTVKVRARVTTTMSGFYAKSGHNHLYHYTSSCPSSGSHCPTLTVTVAPNKAGQRLQFYLQVRRSGHWHTVADFRAKLGSRSRVKEIMIYGSSAIIGVPTRVHAIYQGDEQNTRATSKWAYFEVTR